MSDIGEHYCSACGEQHGGHARKDPDVEIARINAERDVEVARIQRGEAKAVVETSAEVELAVAEVEAEAAVAVAEATDAPAEDGSEDGNQAIIVEGPPAEPAEEEPEPTLEPKEENLPEPAASKSRGYWG